MKKKYVKIIGIIIVNIITLIRLFGSLYLYDGEKAFFFPHNSVWKYKFSELKHELMISPWKTGYLKKMFGRMFPAFLTYKLLNKK